MAMGRFSTRLEHRWVKLHEPADAVRFSFIVRNSLSYLNLDLGEYFELNNRSRTVIEVANDFVNTEEKCRKVFTPSRSLLYTMHLDLPAAREYSLKNDQYAYLFSEDSYIPHIAKITVQCGFFSQIISDIIENIPATTDHKLKILRFLLKSHGLKINIFISLESHVLDSFIDLFYPEISDSFLFKDFIKYFNLAVWMTDYEKPDILEFLFYHAHQNGRDLEEDGYSLDELMDNCILHGFFLNITPCLKYTDAPGFTFEAYEVYKAKISSLRPNLTEEVFAKAERSLKPERIYLILQILWMHIESGRLKCTEAASEALRLIWNSFHYPCTSFEEVTKAFAGTLADQELRDMYDLYCNSIGEFPSNVRPRPLKHLTRILIRRILRENNFWLPTGIRLTGLPRSLQSFLNLEKVIPKLDYNTNLYE